MTKPSNWLIRALGFGSEVETGKIDLTLEEEIGRIAPEAGGDGIFFTVREFLVENDDNPPWTEAFVGRSVEFERVPKTAVARWVRGL